MKTYFDSTPRRILTKNEFINLIDRKVLSINTKITAFTDVYSLGGVRCKSVKDMCVTRITQHKQSGKIVVWARGIFDEYRYTCSYEDIIEIGEMKVDKLLSAFVKKYTRTEEEEEEDID